MGLTNITAAAAVFLAGLLPASCHKNSPHQKSPAPVPSATTGATNKLSLVCDLGEVTLTNHAETCVQLGDGTVCTLTPKMLDSRNVQITLLLATKTNTGKIHDLALAQIITRPGQPCEVAVGDVTLTLRPNIAAE